MGVRIVLATVALLAAAPAWAQSSRGLPDTIASSGLTRAQEDELGRRLAALQGRFSALATETELRESAVRNIAVEIFGARPDLDFDAFARTIENGARELRAYVDGARARTGGAPELAALRQRAIAAAEQGQLREARALYDDIIALSRVAREQQRGAQDLADAADVAEAGRLAVVAADYSDADRRYSEAVSLSHSDAHVRWHYLIRQAEAKVGRSIIFGGTEPLLEAVNLYRVMALPLVPRASLPADWAATQEGLGVALTLLGQRNADQTVLRGAVSAIRLALFERSRANAPIEWALAQYHLGGALTVLGEVGDEASLREAVIAYRGALEVYTPNGNPREWGWAQNGLGLALRGLGSRGDDALLDEALAAFRASLIVFTRAETPFEWADSQINIGNSLLVIAVRNEDATTAQAAVAALRAALTVRTRETAPGRWAQVQYGLGGALHTAGALTGDETILRESVAAFRSALEVRTRDAGAGDWAMTQNGLGVALRPLGERGNETAMRESVAAFHAALEVFDQANNPAMWVVIQINVAPAYNAMVVRFHDRSFRGRARQAAQGALRVAERIGDDANAARARALLQALAGR